MIHPAPEHDPQLRVDAVDDHEPIVYRGGPEYQRVVEVALAHFAKESFSLVHISDISAESGMSKRMIYYHFRDKAGLYRVAYATALALVRPSEESLIIDSHIPVDGVRQVAEASFRSFVSHPQAAALLHRESLQHILGDNPAPSAGRAPVLAQLDKLLMVGQDAGAFRPDIGAFDVYLLICSLAMARGSLGYLATSLYGVSLTSEANTIALQRLVVDTVLAFLTSNIPDSGLGGYLVADAEAPVSPAAAPEDVYQEGEGAGPLWDN